MMTAELVARSSASASYGPAGQPHGHHGRRTQNIENNPMQSSLAVAGMRDPLPAGTEQQLDTRIILSSELAAALPSRHALARKAGALLTLGALSGEPWILFPENDGPGSLFLKSTRISEVVV